MDDRVYVSHRAVAQSRCPRRPFRLLGPAVRGSNGVAGDPGLVGEHLADGVGDLLPGVALALEPADEVEHGLVVLASRDAGWSSAGLEELAIERVQVHRRELLKPDAADVGATCSRMLRE